MKVLYIFPHPDDESFGPSLVISKLKREGHQVYLLTLTKGGATKERFKLGVSIEEMGEIRHKEMLDVANVLGLDGITVLDLPDSGLKDLDPRVIEDAVRKHILLIKPDIVATYPVHGISGFFDHIVTHAVVKRVYAEMKNDDHKFLKRLAFYTLNDEQAKNGSKLFSLKSSRTEDLDCCVKVSGEDVVKFRESLACYKTYKDVISQSGISEIEFRDNYFEFYMEQYNPVTDNLFTGL